MMSEDWADFDDDDDRQRQRHPRQRPQSPADDDQDQDQDDEDDGDPPAEAVTSSRRTPVDVDGTTAGGADGGGDDPPPPGPGGADGDGGDVDVDVIGEVLASGTGGAAPSSKPATTAPTTTATATTTTSRREKLVAGARYVAHVAEKVTTKRSPGALPGAVLTKLESGGAGYEPIRSMRVVRTPLEEVARRMLRVISLGAFDDAVRESPYDSMFHLSLLLNGRYGLHKCEVIRLVEEGVDGTATIVTPESEVMDVPLFASSSDGSGVAGGATAMREDGGTPTLTIASLLVGTRLFMGDRKFTNYDPRNNNCQDFIVSVLRSCGASTADLERFVKQDAEEVFRRLPLHAPLVAKLVTDGAAVGDKLWEEVRVRLRESDSQLVGEVRCLRERYGDKVPISGERMGEVASVLREMRAVAVSSSGSEGGEEDGDGAAAAAAAASSTSAPPSSSSSSSRGATTGSAAGLTRHRVRGKISGGVKFLRDLHENLSDEYVP